MPGNLKFPESLRGVPMRLHSRIWRSLRWPNSYLALGFVSYQTFETDIELVANQKSTIKTELVKISASEEASQRE